jgi:hypothetical protein
MRRPALIAIALAALTVLSGCTGIPTSGSVNQGNAIDYDVDVAPGFLPSGPVDGSDPETLLQDFMQAVTSPTDNYKIARQFLASDVSQTWRPNAGVLIRADRADVAEVAGSESTLQYTIRSAANVDERGGYSRVSTPETVPPLQFRFVQENGQWRISELDDGIVLSTTSFNALFAAYPLYFFDPTYTFLVPDARWFPQTNLVTTRIRDALLAGPSAWLTGAVTTAFVPGTTARSTVPVESGVATVELSVEARDADDEGRNRMRQQLSASYANVQTVTSVEITVGGVELPITESSAVQAIVQPSVNPLPLVGREDELGFASSTSITPIDALTDGALSVGATSAALAGDILAVGTPNGVVAVTATGDPVSADARAGLVEPSIDNFGFIWSAQAARADSLRIFEANGASHDLTLSSLDPGARVVSIDVARDGTRLLLYLMTDDGPSLGVASITRVGTLPTSLGEFVSLPVSSGAPIDATWVDNRTVAALYAGVPDTSVVAYEVGGPIDDLGTIPDGVSITSIGDGGIDNLRALSSDGELYRPRNTSWQGTGITASFLGTQQPG